MVSCDRHLSEVVAALVLLACAAWAGEGPAPPPKPATHTVEPELLKIETQLKGVFESPTMAEIVFRPDAWGELTVLQAVAPGTRVKKGDLLLSLDTTKIDEAIENADAALALMAPAVTLAQEELTALDKSLPLDLVDAERAKQVADEDLKRHHDIERPTAVKQANFSVRNAANGLAYQQEELRQLEKMYKADDLTEETEEIVLKRQRDAVESAAFGLELAQVYAERTLKIDLPRKDLAVQENAERQAIALAKAKAALPAALARKRLELDKMKSDQKEAAEKLRKLRKDREGMVAKSPADGVAYPGPCVRGTWPKLGQDLPRGTGLKAHDVVLTIVEPRPRFVRAVVPEDQLERVAPGAEGHAAPVGYPNLKLRAKVEAVSPIPVGAGSFEAKLAITVPNGAPPLVPGMNCTVKLLFYLKKDALTVPTAAVFTDEANEEAAFLYVRKPDQTTEKRPVTVGKRTEAKVEILQGLAKGDNVLLESPKK